MKKHLLIVWMTVIMVTGLFYFHKTVGAWPLNETDVPASLLPWKAWVLYGMEEKLCPTDCDNDQAYRCAWPSRLTLTVQGTGGDFEQEWTVFARTWARLPGGIGTWPEKITDGGVAIPVVNRNDLPFLLLEKGSHAIKGVFSWKEMPETIRVPPETGIISLVVNQKRIDHPVIDTTGSLWLQKRGGDHKEADTGSLSIFRLLDDTIPMEITTHLTLQISGQAREICFQKVLLPKSAPMSMKSPLPVRIGAAGELTVQARPGRWEIDIKSRLGEPPIGIGPVAGAYGPEIWSFSPQNHLRMVQIEGVPSVEPERTDMPQAWKNFSAYRVAPGGTVRFKVLKRGDPDPAPDRISLNRIFWLDFNGGGYSVQDTFTGTISRTWRLSMNPPGELGRVAVDGEAQLITADPKTGHAGVELRKGSLNMTADSRFTASIATLPAVGWNHDISAMTGVLNLPPGWRLFAATGIDDMPGSFLLQWTLLDFFIVLIIAAGVFKLRGWPWGLAAFITMTLIYHETGAPRIVWLHILAALSLKAVLPENRFRRLVSLWGGAALIALILIVIPFMVTQIRYGIFPQLDIPHAFFQPREGTMMGKAQDHENAMMPSMMAEAPMLEQAPPTPASQGSIYMDRSVHRGKKHLPGGDSLQKKALMAQDPNALIQTGPGLPSWEWLSIPMTWNGPVKQDQEIRLFLVSPSLNLMLSLLRVGLLCLMIAGVADFSSLLRKVRRSVTGTAMAASLLALFSGIAHASAETVVFPPQELLDTYQERLLEKAGCFPHCADCLKMEVSFDPDHLRIMLEIHAAEKTALPLPGSRNVWSPDQVLLNDLPARELSRDSEGRLFALVPYGIHRILLTGKTGSGETLQIPLPMKPHTASASGTGWEIQGIHKDGTAESGIQLTRLQKESAHPSEGARATLPPFLHIERVIHLGLTWEVDTTVTRITPTGTPVLVPVPLIDGESVTTASVRVEKGQALVNMDAETTILQWNGSLKQVGGIVLKAPDGVPWTESWIVDASPIWHCETSGIPAVHHQDEAGAWRPQWRPWPGESVSIQVTRPEGIPGKITTIDSSELVVTPGSRLNQAQLTLKIRASQGGQHTITLPEKAELQQVTLNAQSLPVKEENHQVLAPIQPGSQTLFLEWNEPSGQATLIRGPAVHIGQEAVNAHVRFQMPPDRWIIWVFGPALGPAVLYWSYIGVILLTSLFLGRIPLTPLKTRHFLILGLGLTQIPVYMALVVAGWFFLLGLRKKYPPLERPLYFNLTQVLIGAWTLAAFLALYAAISNGLLGIPDMRISGNGSTGAELSWTADRIDGFMPQPGVLSLPKMVYNLMMLIWALWLAFHLISWLRWGWEAFSQGALWKKITWKNKRSEASEINLTPPGI
jgi:hypothetical protein